jgi:hypothetical protein
LLVQGGSRTLEKTLRYVVQFCEIEGSHTMDAKIQAIPPGRKSERGEVACDQ